MLDLDKLTNNDIGKWVVYKGGAGEMEYRRIKFWNKSVVFVVYERDSRDMEHYENYNAIATSPEDLTFMK